jgi:hypothetical protein
MRHIWVESSYKRRYKFCENTCHLMEFINELSLLCYIHVLKREEHQYLFNIQRCASCPIHYRRIIVRLIENLSCKHAKDTNFIIFLGMFEFVSSSNSLACYYAICNLPETRTRNIYSTIWSRQFDSMIIIWKSILTYFTYKFIIFNEIRIKFVTWK